MTFSQSPWKLSDLFPASDAPQLQAAFDEPKNKSQNLSNTVPI